MVWFVQPLERKDADGNPSGLWHLTAKSDEGGGFHVGCNHDHASADEAQDCREAQVELGKVTGFPPDEPKPAAARFFLSTDDEGHWYVVPVDRRTEWYAWREIPSDDERSWEPPEFAKAVGGSLYHVTFTDPVIS